MKKKIVKIVFLILMAMIAAALSYRIFVIEKKRADIAAAIEQIEKRESYAIMAPPSPPPPDGESLPTQTVIQVSPTDGLKVILQETTSWNTILQLIFTLLASYLGIKLINKHAKE